MDISELLFVEINVSKLINSQKTCVEMAKVLILVLYVD
jgi:hypothetical protein